MEENWVALAIAIMRGCCADTALDAVTTGKVKYNDQDDSEMVYLYKVEGLSIGEAAELFGLSKSALHKRMDRFLKKGEGNEKARGSA